MKDNTDSDTKNIGRGGEMQQVAKRMPKAGGCLGGSGCRSMNPQFVVYVRGCDHRLITRSCARTNGAGISKLGRMGRLVYSKPCRALSSSRDRQAFDHGVAGRRP